jgi:FkbM family methyltransferase
MNRQAKLLAKRIYDRLPLKPRIFKILRPMHLPPRLYRHLHFKALIDVQVNGSGFFKIMHYGYAEENELFWAGLEGCWESVSLALWRRLARNAKVVCDVGANHGVYSLVAKTVNRSAKVFAFEPVEAIFRRFRENCKLNQYDIEPIQAAVSDFDGQSVLHVPVSEHSSSASLSQEFIQSKDARTRAQPVTVVRLDTFFRQNGVPEIHLLKIDAETAESKILRGLGSLLSARPSMIIEVLSDEAGREIESIVAGVGYLFFDIDEKSKPKQRDHIARSSRLNYLLCQPAAAKELGLI